MLNDIRKNPLLLTDSYNMRHGELKANTDWEVSHLYNRAKGMYLLGFNEIIDSVITIKIEQWMIDEAVKIGERRNERFPAELWQRVVDECNGNIPLLIEAIPEGIWIPKGTPFAQVQNTIEGFGELVTWFEGVMLQAYFPSGVLTETYHIYDYLKNRGIEQGISIEDMVKRVHYFGFRGQRSVEDAYWTALAWHMIFSSSDDLHFDMHHTGLHSTSISATAHKVTQQFDNEYDSYTHNINAIVNAGEKVLSMVIDTYNANRFIQDYLIHLASYAKKLDVHLVLRPDSGNTVQQAIDIYNVCQKYKIDNISVILGEGMSLEKMKEVDDQLIANNVPLTFVTIGIGAGLFNHITRDYLGFAMKTAFSNGKPRMKFSENPIKRSIPSEVILFLDANENVVVESIDYFDEDNFSIEPLYNVVYFYTKEDSEKFIKDLIFPRYQYQITQMTINSTIDSPKQEVIVLSEGIKNLMDALEKEYVQ